MFVKEYGASAAHDCQVHNIPPRPLVGRWGAAALCQERLLLFEPRRLRQCFHLVTSAQPTEERLDNEYSLDEVAELAEKKGKWLRAADAELGDWRFDVCLRISAKLIQPCSHLLACVLERGTPCEHGSLSRLVCKNAGKLLNEFRALTEPDAWTDILQHVPAEHHRRLLGATLRKALHLLGAFQQRVMDRVASDALSLLWLSWRDASMVDEHGMCNGLADPYECSSSMVIFAKWHQRCSELHDDTSVSRELLSLARDGDNLAIRPEGSGIVCSMGPARFTEKRFSEKPPLLAIGIEVEAPEQDEEEVIEPIAGIEENDDDYDEVVSACAAAEAAEFQEATKEATTLLPGDNFRDKHPDDDDTEGADPVAAIVDAVVGKDLKAMSHANSEPQPAFTEVLLELARDSCARVLSAWSSAVAATREAFAFRNNARWTHEPLDMLLVERVVEEASAVDLVAATRDPATHQVVPMEGTSWKFQMKSGPLATASFCNASDFSVVVPNVGVRMDKSKIMWQPLPHEVAHLRSLWEKGIDAEASPYTAPEAASLSPCLLCRGCGDVNFGLGERLAVEHCKLRLQHFHRCCAKAFLAAAMDSDEHVECFRRESAKKTSYPRTLLGTITQANVGWMMCELCLTLDIDASVP